MSNEQQPMTAEQLAGIADQVNEDWEADVPHHQQWYREMLRSLLDEVQRQQGEIERLKVVSEQARIDVEVIEGKIDGMYATQARLQAENDQLRQQLSESEQIGYGAGNVLDTLTQAHGKQQAEINQLRQQLGEAVEALEWYERNGKDESSWDLVLDRGFRAREVLTKLKGDRTE